MPLFQSDQEIQVAARPGLAARHRAEDAHVTRPVIGSQAENLVATNRNLTLDFQINCPLLASRTGRMAWEASAPLNCLCAAPSCYPAIRSVASVTAWTSSRV